MDKVKAYKAFTDIERKCHDVLDDFENRNKEDLKEILADVWKLCQDGQIELDETKYIMGVKCLNN